MENSYWGFNSDLRREKLLLLFNYRGLYLPGASSDAPTMLRLFSSCFGARWEWRAMCTHSRASFSHILCWNLLLNPVLIRSFILIATGCWDIVAHRSPTRKLHLDLTSWGVPFCQLSWEVDLRRWYTGWLILGLVRCIVGYRFDGKLLQGDLENRQVLWVLNFWFVVLWCLSSLRLSIAGYLILV